MTTHRRVRWGAAALVVVLVGLLGGSHLCGVALEKEASDPGMRPIGGGALACTEFWLNRYQTLITAVVALIALKGIRYSQQQAHSAAKQSSISSFEFYADRLEKLYEFDDQWTKVLDVINSINPYISNDQDKDVIIALAKIIDEKIPTIRRDFDVLLVRYDARRDATIIKLGIMPGMLRDLANTYTIYMAIGEAPPARDIVGSYMREIARSNVQEKINFEIEAVKKVLSSVESYLNTGP